MKNITWGATLNDIWQPRRERKRCLPWKRKSKWGVFQAGIVWFWWCICIGQKRRKLILMGGVNQRKRHIGLQGLQVWDSLGDFIIRFGYYVKKLNARPRNMAPSLVQFIEQWQFFAKNTEFSKTATTNYSGWVPLPTPGCFNRGVRPHSCTTIRSFLNNCHCSESIVNPRKTSTAVFVPQVGRPQ